MSQLAMLDKYTVCFREGSGADTFVFCVENEQRNQFVVKIISHKLPQDQHAFRLGQLNNELNILQEESFPGTVKVYDVCPGECTQTGQETKIVHYLLMEKIDGGDLENITSLFGQTKIQENTLHYLCQKVLHIFTEIHQRGYVHLDIKPDNIMVDLTGEVKVIDFGLAKKIDQSASQVGVFGTIPQIAPEMYSDTCYNPQKADVFSLGVLLFRILFQCVPWRDSKENDPNFANFKTKNELFWQTFSHKVGQTIKPEIKGFFNNVLGCDADAREPLNNWTTKFTWLQKVVDEEKARAEIGSMAQLVSMMKMNARQKGLFEVSGSF